MTLPAAFLFDMDGLLLDTERLFMVPFIALCQRENVPQNDAEAFYLSLIGSSEAGTRAKLTEFLPNHVDVARFDAEWRQRYEDMLVDTVPLRPFAMDILQAIKDLDAPMALVTSTNGASARAKLTKAGIIGFFDVIKAGDEVSANKPDPAPYREAAEALGVDPKNCVAFEDSDTGTRSAVAAGCNTYQIPDLRPAGKALPELGQIVMPDLRAALLDLGLSAETAV